MIDMMDANITPKYQFVIYDSGNNKETLRILPDGRIILGPGITLDAASLDFWRVMEDTSPGICQRILDERRK